MRKRILGFTLIELMIVVAIIAIIAAIAIPNILRARMSANEGSAIGTLRNLATAQQTFQSNNIVDQDSDGTGEYGVLNELTGAQNCRSNGEEKAPVNPGYITTVLAVTSGSDATKSGYNTRVYLPGGTTDAADDTPAAETAVNTINAQENRWLAYSWPASFRTSGIRCFCVDQGAEVVAAPNTDNAGDPEYEGTNNGPAFSAALSGTADPAWAQLAVRDADNSGDGQLWVPSN